MFLTRIFIGACLWFVCCRCSSCFEGSCYYLGPMSTWHSAVSYCADTGGVLTSIQSREVNNFLSITFVSACHVVEEKPWFGCWIGMNDISVDNTWEWYDGSTVNYSHWAPGEPNHWANEDCVQIVPSGYWNDVICTKITIPICKIVTSSLPSSIPTEAPTIVPTSFPSNTST